MSLLGSLLHAVKTVTEAAGDIHLPDEPSTRELEERVQKDARSFDDKLKEILTFYPGVSVETNILPDELEVQAGREIYARKNSYCLPDPISYKLTHNGKVLYIRFWKNYNDYDHITNRQVKMYCDQSHIPMLDFFGHLPNAFSYMQERIGGALLSM